MKNRSRTEIVVQILEIANVGSDGGYDVADGVIQTKIMYEALLSYAQLKEYLTVLLKTTCLTMTQQAVNSKQQKKLIGFLKSTTRWAM